MNLLQATLAAHTFDGVVRGSSLVGYAVEFRPKQSIGVVQCNAGYGATNLVNFLSGISERVWFSSAHTLGISLACEAWGLLDLTEEY